MNEPPKPSLLERLSSMLLREPEDRQQLIELLHSAFERRLLDADALSMIEGVMQVSETQVRDVMIPRSQMDMIDVAQSPEGFIPFVIEKAHSRFPVFEDNRDNVIGILLAKDLLRFYAEHDFNVREMLRPAVFVPEAKRLNVLLKEFRANRNHIAIVVDEYDFDETEDNILADRSGRYRVKAVTEIGDFNNHFGTNFADDDYDTVGGLVVKHFGRLPKRGDVISIDGYGFQVVRSDSRKVHSLLVEKPQAEAKE